MEDTKLYSTQNIERLKQKIAVYRETLTTLKQGTSIEEFLNKKEEFDGFKIQMAHLEGLAKTLDEKQDLEIEGYGEKVNQIANQIDVLNKTVEEISSFMNKELKNEEEKRTDFTKNQSNMNTPFYMANGTLKTTEEIPQVKEPLLLTNIPPSYLQLQKLAGLARSTKPEALIEPSSPGNPTTKRPPEERHFNHQYFQSINTHPSHMYNGLYKNIANTSSFHFKNESSIQEIPIHKNEPTEMQPNDLANEASHSVVPIVDEVDPINISAEEMIDSINSIVDDSENSITVAEEIEHSPVQIIDKIESSIAKANEIVVAVASIVDEEPSIDTIPDEVNVSTDSKTNGAEVINTILEETDHFTALVDDEVAFMDAVAEDITEFSFDLPFEEASIETESSEMNILQEEPLNNLNTTVSEEHKKEGFSTFFNLFRRRV